MGLALPENSSYQLTGVPGHVLSRGTFQTLGMRFAVEQASSITVNKLVLWFIWLIWFTWFNYAVYMLQNRPFTKTVSYPSSDMQPFSSQPRPPWQRCVGWRPCAACSADGLQRASASNPQKLDNWKTNVLLELVFDVYQTWSLNMEMQNLPDVWCESSWASSIVFD